MKLFDRYPVGTRVNVLPGRVPDGYEGEQYVIEVWDDVRAIDLGLSRNAHADFATHWIHICRIEGAPETYAFPGSWY